MNNIMVERKLTVTHNDGSTSQITITIHKPFLSNPSEDSNNVELWYCYFSIDDPQVPLSMNIHGLDGLDALERVIRLIQGQLDTIKEHYRERISWLLADELPDGGPLRSGQLRGEHSWQLHEESKLASTETE